MPSADALRVLRREIETDLSAVERLMKQLAEARQNLGAEPPEETLIHVGYLLHSIYTGWESAMRRIATVFENRLDPGQWHVQLIRRMTLDIPGVRPAVLDAASEEHLATMRSFRHFFRHNYGVPLRWRKMEPVLESYDAVRPSVERSFRRFLAEIEKLADLSEEA
jgi:hypothetical protein